jgi:hypothetical protein
MSFVRTNVAPARGADAFQADDEGSIPFTRSNHFKSLLLISPAPRPLG